MNSASVPLTEEGVSRLRELLRLPKEELEAVTPYEVARLQGDIAGMQQEECRLRAQGLERLLR